MSGNQRRMPLHYWGGWACFVTSILLIGVLTAFVGDLASHFGCTIGLKDSVTAISLVALGTSIPDTFASKVAAQNDKYADSFHRQRDRQQRGQRLPGHRRRLVAGGAGALGTRDYVRGASGQPGLLSHHLLRLRTLVLRGFTHAPQQDRRRRTRGDRCASSCPRPSSSAASGSST
ncbi:hypothetical protein MTO96_018733 [Rhipicephalus appendiculatus]